MASNLVVRKKKSPMDSVVQRHGSTEPNRLEHKRQDITKTVASIFVEISELTKLRDKLIEEKSLTPDLEVQVRSAITSMTVSAATLNALGLLVDCVSVRYPVKSAKTGRRGFTRYAAGQYTEWMFDELLDVRRLLEKFTKVSIKDLPDDDDSAEEDDREIFEENQS